MQLIVEEDTVVPAVENAPRKEAALALGVNSDYSVVVFPGANHLFHKADASGRVARCQSFLPEYLAGMADWVLARCVG